MSRGKAYTQEIKEEIFEAYKEGMTIEQICKYVAKGRPAKGIRNIIKQMENNEVENQNDQSETVSDNDEIASELRRMNDLKLRELDLLNSIWISLRNIAVNTKNLADEWNGKDGN